MAEITQLDVAWEAVNALGSAGQDALRAIEQLGAETLASECETLLSVCSLN